MITRQTTKLCKCDRHRYIFTRFNMCIACRKEQKPKALPRLICNCGNFYNPKAGHGRCSKCRQTKEWRRSYQRAYRKKIKIASGDTNSPSYKTQLQDNLYISY